MRTWVRVVVLGVLVGLLAAAGVLARSPDSSATAPPGVRPRELEGGQVPFDAGDVADRSSAGIHSAGGLINIADTSAREQRPSVAMCPSNEYLVAYQRNATSSDPAAIYGQRVTSGGALLGTPFQINTGEANDALHPDVACESSHNRFVVVWEYDYEGDMSDVDLHAQLVYGAHQTSGSQLEGSRLYVSEVREDGERQPAIACNNDGASCLVAFEYHSGGAGIHGQRVAVTAGELSLDGDPFVVADSAYVDIKPDVAWGSLDGNYLVVWQSRWDPAPTHQRIVMTHVHDTEQGTGVDERQHAATWLIDPSTWTKDQERPAVAYNPLCGDEGRYLVTFSYDFGARDIAAQRVWGTGMSVSGPPFLAASGPLFHQDSRVAANGRLDQFLVVFDSEIEIETTWSYSIHGQRVQGTHDSGAGGQLRGPVLEMYTSPNDGADSFMGLGDVTGPPNNADYFAVWHDAPLVADEDVFGYLLEPYSTYLPCVMRDD